MKIPFNRLNFQFSARQINLRFLRFLLKKFFHFINKIACNPNRIKLQLLLNSTISCCDSQSLFEYSEQLPLNCVVLSGQVICLLSLTSLKSQIWITAVERSCAAARNWARRVYGGRTLGCGVAGTRPGPDHPVTSHYQTTKQYRHKCTAAVRPLDHPPILGSSALRLAGQPGWCDMRYKTVPASSALTSDRLPARSAGLASQFDALLPAEIFDPPARHRSQLCGDCKQQQDRCCTTQQMCSTAIFAKLTMKLEKSLTESLSVDLALLAFVCFNRPNRRQCHMCMTTCGKLRQSTLRQS